MKKNENIEKSFALATERYAETGVEVNRALKILETIPISLHCWQGDDVGGFENSGQGLGGGLVATGNYPGKARTPDELRADLEKTFSLIPGRHRLNLHAFYGEFGGRKIDRDEIAPKHFKNWIGWARKNELGLDFNPTCFSHPKAADGFTLSHRDKAIRQFWIEHCIRSREIGAAIGKTLGKKCITNIWIPDGMKDTPADRNSPRARLTESLDKIFAKKISSEFNLDSVEPKLFGIGSESYITGSHEFYLGYATTRGKMMTLDAGHYHPTESIADKISSVLQFLPEILLHVSRGVRWDSDHVVTLNDDLLSIAREIAANDFSSRVHIGLDYFDASINRVAAWTIGARNMIRALLIALLEPVEKIRAAENRNDFTTRLALQEEIKSLPFGAVWDYYCQSKNVPVGENWLFEIKRYEKETLSKR
ncbi:MAG TPA: L-rhamnose isomerase [Candidatus Acidoferrales bacterium]|jgi:L-rhamnose isomerase|nr:L-rhamnose isomerase [Candidatus Acidoferrales bacterium]